MAAIAKLTDYQYIEIFYSDDSYSILADQYSVTKAMISTIKLKKSKRARRVIENGLSKDYVSEIIDQSRWSEEKKQHLKWINEQINIAEKTYTIPKLIRVGDWPQIEQIETKSN